MSNITGTQPAKELSFVNPKNDVAFRKIFGDENKKEILISFLNNILEFAGTNKEIVDITIKNPYQVPRLLELKETILDIKAVDKRGIHYIIEMQVFHTAAFEKRVLYYVSKAYHQQLDKGDDYPRLNQVIFLGFLDFAMFEGNPHYCTRHLFLEEKSNEHYFQDFELNFVELPKFNKPLDRLEDVKDKWIYFVKHAGDMKMIPEELQNPRELMEAFASANQMSWSRVEMEAYEERGILIQDERGRIEFAEKSGLERGEKIGLEKGIQQEKIQVAKKMKAKGNDGAFIAEITGLPTHEIDKL